MPDLLHQSLAQEHATVCDAKGNPVPESTSAIQFTLKGNGKLIGENPIKAEAGIATILLQAGNKAGTIIIQATNATLKSGQLKIVPVK
jgi:beta-galactosidase